MNPQHIHDTLITELGLEGLQPEQQQEAVAIIGGPVLQSVTLALLEHLPTEAQSSFQEALEEGDAVRIETIISAHIPNSTEFIEYEVQKAIAEFKSLEGK
jgi:hypothetical protein